MRTAEAGYALLEVTVSVGILALAGLAGAGAVAALARGAPVPQARGAALDAAENALVRARAAAAYADAIPGGTASGTARATVRCGGRDVILQLPLTSGYVAGTRTFSVRVDYPRDPCGAPGGALSSVALDEVEAAAADAPGTVRYVDVQTPARM